MADVLKLTEKVKITQALQLFGRGRATMNGWKYSVTKIGETYQVDSWEIDNPANNNRINVYSPEAVLELIEEDDHF